MLSASDREQARAVLRSQQSALHQRIRACLEAAYGIRPDTDGCLGTVVPAGGSAGRAGHVPAADAGRRDMKDAVVGAARQPISPTATRPIRCSSRRSSPPR